MNVCPKLEQLRRLAVGELSLVEADQIVAHVDQCQRCEQQLDHLESRIGLGKQLAQSPAPCEKEPEFQRLMENLRPVKPFPTDSNIKSDFADGSKWLPDSSRVGEESQSTTGLRQKNLENIVIPGYEILEVLGQGGMGIVYLARNVRLKRLAAIKMVIAGAQASEEELSRFASEAELVAQLRHPNIVEIFEVGEFNQSPYFALEYVAGGSLHDYLAESSLSARRAAQIIRSIALAMAYAHDHGVIHRDLKPANILLSLRADVGSGSSFESPTELSEEISGLLSDEGSGNSASEELVPKISDFGLAKQMDSDLGQTRTGALVGTPKYMAPEQAAGHKSGPAVDIYAMGAILYHLLTGLPPFVADSLLSLMKRIREDEPVSPRRLRPKLSRDLETICLKCLEKSPSRRYLSSSDLAADLNRFLNGQPIVARPIGLTERAAKWARRYPVIATALVLLLVASCVVSWKWIEAANANQKLTAAIDDADKARAAAKVSESVAIKERNFSRRREADLLFNKGLELCRNGDSASGLHWMIAALRAFPADEPDAEAFERMIRTNIPAWLTHTHKLERVIEHSHWVLSGDFLPDQKTIVTVAADGVLRFFDADSGFQQDEIKISHRGSNDFTRCLAVAPDGQRIVIGQNDGVLVLVDVAKRKIIRSWNAHSTRVRQVVWSPDGRKIVSTSRDETARVWTMNGDPFGKPIQHVGVVRDVAFAPTGESFMTVTNPEEDETTGLIQRWNAESLQLMGTPIEIDYGVTAIAIHPFGECFVTAGPDGVARIWDYESMNLIGEFHNLGLVWSLQFSPDGRRIAAASDQGQVTLWDAQTHQQTGSSIHHRARVFCARFDATGERLVTCSHDKSLRIWNLSRAESRSSFSQTNPDFVKKQPELWRFAVPRAAFSPDRKSVILSIPRQGRVAIARLWDVENSRLLTRPLYLPFDTVRQFQFSPDGKYVAAVGYPHGKVSGGACVFETASGRMVSNLPHGYYSSVLEFNSDGTKLAVGDYQNLVRIWNPVNGEQVGKPLVHQDIIYGLAFNQDKLAVGTTADRSGRPLVHLWDLESQLAAAKPVLQSAGIKGLKLCPNSRILLILTDEPRLVDAETLQLIGKPLTESQATRASCFDSTGKMVALGGQDKQVRIWNTEDSSLRRTLSQSGAVRSIAFSASGSLLLVGCDDGQTQLWDLATGYPLGPPYRQRFPVLNVGFSKDESHCLAVVADESIHRWTKPEPYFDSDLDSIESHVEMMTVRFLNDNNQVIPMSVASWSKQKKSSEGAVEPKYGSTRRENWHAAHFRHAQQDEDFFGALWHLDRLLEIREGDNLVRIHRAGILSGLRMYPQAAQDYQTVQSSLPVEDSRLANWYHWRAIDCRDREQWETAKWYLDRILEWQPQNWRALADRSEVSRFLGQPGAGDADLKLSIRLSSDRSFLLSAIEILAAKGDWESVRSVYQRVKQSAELSVIDGYKYSLALLENGDAKTYDQICRILIEPNHRNTIESHAANLLAWTGAVGLCDSESLSSAIQLAEQLYATKSGKTDIGKISTYATIHYEAGPPDVRSSLAALYFRAGSFEKAEKLYNEILASGNTTAADCFFAAMNCIGLNEPDEAKQWADRGRRLAAESKDPWVQLEIRLLSEQLKASDSDGVLGATLK